MLWAVAAVVARTLFDDGLDPLELTQARAFLTLGGLALLRPWRRGPAIPCPPGLVVALGLAITLVNSAYYLAIERLPVAIALVVQYTAPVMVVAWVSLLRRALPSRPVALALIAGVGGVTIASELGTVPLDEIDGIGMMLALASAVLFATYTLLSERAVRSYGPSGAMFRAFLAASVFWLLIDVFRGLPTELVEASNLPRVLFVGLVGTLAPFMLYVWGVRHVSSERAVIAASLEPPSAALMAWIWLSQELSTAQILGGILVIIAVVLLQTQKREPVLAPEP